MQIPNINLEAIPNAAMRQIVVQMLNLIEMMAAENTALCAKNQHLRDENARLTGGSGKPDIKPPVPPASTDHSSEIERQTRTPCGKPKKNKTLTVTREERCPVDSATLPPDIVQDLRSTVDVICFIREVWYIPSTKTPITAPLPPGYHGAFGPIIHALGIALGHGANISQPTLLTFLRDMGIRIVTGTLARMLLDPTDQWVAEANTLHRTGVDSNTWVASDQTATRVDGQNEVCHVVGNIILTSYHTRPGNTCQDVLAVLWNQEPVFRLNDEAMAWLDATSLPASLRKRLLVVLPWVTELMHADLHQHLTDGGVRLTRKQQQPVWDALAVAAYHTQTCISIQSWLLRDDAAVYDHLTDTHALCGIHDANHYTKLRLLVPGHQRLLTDFRTEYWAFYCDLLAYRKDPWTEERNRLANVFDTLVDRKTGYAALDDRIVKTAAKRSQLRAVRDHSDLPLHNNDMELAARWGVRKRDVSFGPQSCIDARAGDTFQTIAATATKLGGGAPLSP